VDKNGGNGNGKGRGRGRGRVVGVFPFAVALKIDKRNCFYGCCCCHYKDLTFLC